MTECFSLLTGYIGEFEEVDDHRSGKIVIQLNGRLVSRGPLLPLILTDFSVKPEQVRCHQPPLPRPAP